MIFFIFFVWFFIFFYIFCMIFYDFLYNLYDKIKYIKKQSVYNICFTISFVWFCKFYLWYIFIFIKVKWWKMNKRNHIMIVSFFIIWNCQLLLSCTENTYCMTSYTMKLIKNTHFYFFSCLLFLIGQNICFLYMIEMINSP